RRRLRSPAGAGRGGRDLGAEPGCHDRLLQQPGGHPDGAAAGRLAPHGRPRLRGQGGLPLRHRPLERSDHPGRRERAPCRRRGDPARRAPRPDRVWHHRTHRSEAADGLTAATRSPRPMEFGCHLPVYGPAATREALLAFARRMETLGYDSLWASDHIVIPWRITSKYPYNETGDFPLPPTTNFLEPLTALALVAGATERIRLGTTVLVLPHRHPVLAAKMLATLDHLAPGRVILGAGVGWMREEIELFGVAFEQRGAWSDEALRIMKACWREES